VWDGVVDVFDLPKSTLARIEHYFQSYKTLPGDDSKVRIPWIYPADHARKVIAAAMDDYMDTFGGDPR
jgi:inorganic pyrophosphatase